MKHFVYHIYPKGKYSGKVGATSNIEKRVHIQQGCGLEDYSILLETTNIIEASDAERFFQRQHGYKLDPTPYHLLNCNKMTLPTLTLSKNNDWYSNFNYSPSFFIEQMNEAGGVLIDGITHKSEELIKLITDAIQSSRWDGCYVAARVVDTFVSPTEKHVVQEDFTKSKKSTMVDAYTEVGKEVQRELHQEIADRSNRQQNNCSILKVGNKTSIDLDRMFLMQKCLQQKFPETGKVGEPTMTLTEIATQAQRNLHCFLDEAMEYMDAIGGINDGAANGAWKYWKKDHKKASKQTLADLSDNDLRELQMEVVDMFHFFMNFALLVGMSGSDLYNMYEAKNAENFDRQKRGY